MTAAAASIEVLKKIARPPWYRLQAVMRAAKSLHQWNAAKRDLKRRAPRLELDVSDYDEMLRYSTDRLSGDRRLALVGYFRTGEMLLSALRGAVQRNGRKLEELGSILDFASGYGRATRWIVATCGANRVTASDIDARAVKFCRQTFGVSGFTSTADARQLTHAGRYDAIFVVSLFSHLTLEHWERWATKLVTLLQPNGLLILSTHGMELYERMGMHVQAHFQKVTEGFVYGRVNETKGRLDGEYYGTAFVSEGFVRGFFGKGVGKVIEYVPKGLAEYQDLYVVQRP